MLIQSSINKFGTTAINGNSAAQSIEGFVYISMNSVYHASLAFVGQNMGVKKYHNIHKITWYCLIFVTLVGVVLGGSLFLCGRYVSRIYTDVPGEIDVSYIRLHYLCLPYFLCGIMDVIVGSLRGMGYSMMPMLISLTGACLFRVIWIFTIFQMNHSLFILYVSYPISWIVTFAVEYLMYIIVYKKILKKSQLELISN